MQPTVLLSGAPQPKQLEFMNANTRFVAYGGARGGGKSWAIRKKAVLMCVKYPGIRALVLRRTYPELRDNHILPLMADLQGLAERKAVKYRDVEKAFSFANGSRIMFGYCDNDTDVLQYQGREYDVIFIDEATQFSEFQFMALTACLRGANAFPKRFYLTCNPGGVGHAWVKRLFIDRAYRDTENPADYTFIRALATDNAALMRSDPGYIQMLKNQPEPYRRAWLNGDWNVVAGQYFTEWDENTHVIKPFAIPRHWRVYRAFDYGLDMLACLWIAVDEQMRAYVIREVCEPNLIVSDAARRIREETRESVYATFAPPDMWSRRQETGKSVADLFAQQGLCLIQASNNRVAGWQNMHEWLKPVLGEAGERTARLRVFDTCRNLIRCLPQLRHADRNPDDVENTPHEITHAPDALRYFCVKWQIPAQPPLPDDYEDPDTAYNDGLREFARYGR